MRPTGKYLIEVASLGLGELADGKRAVGVVVDAMAEPVASAQSMSSIPEGKLRRLCIL